MFIKLNDFKLNRKFGYYKFERNLILMLNKFSIDLVKVKLQKFAHIFNKIVKYLFFLLSLLKFNLIFFKLNIIENISLNLKKFYDDFQINILKYYVFFDKILFHLVKLEFNFDL